MELKSIKLAAIYLRKSRDDEKEGSDVLDNHRKTLTDLAKREGYTYNTYEEIRSGSSMEERTELKRLLSDMEQGKFDVVLVMDIDRLSRGSASDFESIKNVFKENAVFLQTPTAIYDYNNIENEFMSDLLSVFAKFEYAQIKKRYKRGKQSGAAKGNWVSGCAPYGYNYNSTTQKLEVNPEEAEVYRYIKTQALEGVTPHMIAKDLRNKEIRTATGKKFSNTTVYRLMTNRVFTGAVIAGKTSVVKHNGNQKQKKNPKSDWTVVENSHEALISPEEFATVARIFAKRAIRPTRIGTGFPLASLVHCKKCGRTHSFMQKSYGVLQMKPCPGINELDEKCGNKGIKVDVVYENIDKRLSALIEELKVSKTVDSGRFDNLTIELKAKKKLVESLDNQLDRLNMLFVEGKIRTKEQYDTQYDKLTYDQANAVVDVKALTEAVASYKGVDPAERVKQLQEFRKVFNDPEVDNKTKNKWALKVIDRIIYERTKNDVSIEVIFQ